MISTRFRFLPGVGGKNHGPIVHGKNGATHTISSFVRNVTNSIIKGHKTFSSRALENGEFPLNMLNYIHSGRLNAKVKLL